MALRWNVVPNDMQSATTRMRWFLRLIPSSCNPLVFPPHQSHFVRQLLLRRRDPFVCFADISPNRGNALKGKLIFICTGLYKPSP